MIKWDTSTGSKTCKIYPFINNLITCSLKRFTLTRDITSTKNKIEKKLDMEELSAIEGESETDYDGQNLNQESDTNEDKKKLLYSSVKKTTPMREGTEQFDET